MSKILYFTAGDTPTSAELAEIAVINGIAQHQYEVQVVNGKPAAKLTATTLSAVASDNSYNDAGSTITASTISASSTDNSFNDSGNGFVTAGFIVGDMLTITGFTGDTDNNTAGLAKATSVAAGKIIVEGVTLVTDAAGESVTIAAPARFLARGFAVGQTVDVKGFTGTVANNIDSGVITTLTAAKMTIGGTDGDVIVNDAAGESVTIEVRGTPKTAAYGSNAEISANYAAGTIPATYKTAGTSDITVFDPADPPNAPGLIATQATVTNGDTLTVDGAAVTLAVAAHVLTGTLAGTKAVVSSTDEIAITSGSGTTKVTLTIAGNAITACVLS